MQRSAKGLHEKLRGADMQDRVSNVHEVLREETVKLGLPREQMQPMKKATNLLAAIALASIPVGVSAIAAKDSRKLSGTQIRAKFAGMQLTDEVHWRYVYGRDGTLTSYSMGTKKVGKWAIEKDELCLYLNESDDGCYIVSLSGKSITMSPSGVGHPLEGILQTTADRE